MATQLPRPALDIHGGGADLIFPHHECEIAQSRDAPPAASRSCASGCTSAWCATRREDEQVARQHGAGARRCCASIAPTRCGCTCSPTTTATPGSTRHAAPPRTRVWPACSKRRVELTSQGGDPYDGADFEPRFRAALDDDLKRPPPSKSCATSPPNSSPKPLPATTCTPRRRCSRRWPACWACRACGDGGTTQHPALAREERGPGGEVSPLPVHSQSRNLPHPRSLFLQTPACAWSRCASDGTMQVFVHYRARRCG